MTRYVYGFDEPSEGGRELLGGKGIGLAEMTQLGVPVPAGFTITTDACRAFMASGGEVEGLDEDEAYTRAAKAGLRTLLHLLASLLPTEAQSAPQVALDMIRRRIEPMVKGLVQDHWQEIALREIIARTFILNFQGAKRPYTQNCRRVSWARRGGFYGHCSGIMGSSQKMLK